MDPSNSDAAKAAYIKARYGDIYMSRQGFPVFDDYAIARVELPDLTGLNSGSVNTQTDSLLSYIIQPELICCLLQLLGS